MTVYNFTQDWFSNNINNWNYLLSHLAGKTGVKALEIGSYEGRSACWLLENILNGPGSSLDCVDPYIFEGSEQVVARFRYNTQRFGNRIQLHVMQSMSWALLPSSREMKFDFIYLDGHHDAIAVLQDAVLLFDLLKEGGIMIFDDYLWKKKDSPTRPLKIVIDGFITIYAERIDLLHKDYQVAIRRKS